jgi:hypothetical protein
MTLFSLNYAQQLSEKIYETAEDLYNVNYVDRVDFVSKIIYLLPSFNETTLQVKKEAAVLAFLQYVYKIDTINAEVFLTEVPESFLNNIQQYLTPPKSDIDWANPNIPLSVRIAALGDLIYLLKHEVENKNYYQKLLPIVAPFEDPIIIETILDQFRN